MGHLTKEDAISEDSLQIKPNESNTNSCGSKQKFGDKLLSQLIYDEGEDDINDKKKHTIPFSYECGDCSQDYRKSGLLFKHTNEHHGGRKCPDCDERFTSSSPYHLHIKKHASFKYSCNECDKEFSTKSNLTTHKNIHLGIKPHKCSKCEKSFSDRSACMRHEKLHSRVGKFEKYCPDCGKGLAMAARLEEHMKTHGGKKFSQEEKMEAVALARELGVRKASENLQVLTSTLANWVKLVTRPVICTRCSYKTFTASVMREHEKTSHSNEGKLPRDFHLPDYKLRAFPCHLCAVRSKNKESLKKHTRRAHNKHSVKAEDGMILQDFKEYGCPT